MFALTDKLWFPDPDQAEEDGLLAIGGDLSPHRLLLAYRSGIFPWFMDEDVIFWFSPPQRMVLFPEELHISKSMKQVIRSNRFQTTKNQAFEKVIQLCAQVHQQQQSATWISKEFVQAYTRLHELGHADSIECGEQHELVGGLYGISIAKIFFGESMFSIRPNASKAALIALCESENYSLIDCQVKTDHLASMGAKNITRNNYLKLLQENIY